MKNAYINGMLLKNTPVEVKISCDQVDWFSSLEKKLTQVQEDLNFYNRGVRGGLT